MNWRQSLVPSQSGRRVDPFTAMQREVNRLFDDMLGGAVLGNVTSSYGAKLHMDVQETEQAFVIQAECPGVDEKDIELTFSDNILTIKGEKKAERDEKSGTVHLVERSYGAFSRQIAVPGEVDSDKIDAKFNKGVLIVTLPKSAKAVEKAKKIEIKS